MALGRYTIKDGDTIHQIARRTLGYADQWWLLVRLNQLDYPYLDTTGTVYADKKVLSIGDTLLVPDNLEDRKSTEPQSASEADPYDIVLGTDIYLSADGDLDAGSTGDLRTTSGLENLLQALRHRLGTRKGELVYHPEYGTNLHLHIGRVNDLARVSMIKSEITQTLLAEPRIKSISSMQIVDELEYLNVTVQAQVIGIDDVTPLNLVITKAA